MSNLWKWPTRTLKWGETPWDDMPREQLLREVQRMYTALISARSVIMTHRIRDDPESPYWRKGGSGGDTLEMVEQALFPYKDDEHDGGGYEPAYGTFFRYAVDLLFDGLGKNWMICEKGDLIGSYEGCVTPPTTCRQCLEIGRGEVPMRPIRWEDLTPHPSR